MTNVSRKLGFYWVKPYFGSPWNVAQWDGRSWMEFMYSLPTPVSDDRMDEVGPYIEEPE